MDLPTQPWFAASGITESQRDALVRFWLAAPQDLLPSLWDGPTGEASRFLVRSLTQSHSFTSAQISCRDAINQRLQQGLNTPLAPQLLLANFLLSPPGLMKIASPDSNLPPWLANAYRQLYEAAQQPSAPVAVAANPQALPEPDFGPFPNSLQELTQNRIHLNRLLGLANLYYIDPEDREIASELIQLRRQLAVIIERCQESHLAEIWATDLGERYWALVRSGVQKEPLEPQDEQLKAGITRRLQPTQGGGFGTPGALNAFLVAMMFFEPGSMRVEGAEQKLPSWLLPSYQQIFAEPLKTQA